jgi:hypothetical protein
VVRRGFELTRVEGGAVVEVPGVEHHAVRGGDGGERPATAGGAEPGAGVEGQADQALDRAGRVVVGFDAEPVAGAVPDVGRLDDGVDDRAGPVAPGLGVGAFRVRGRRTDRGLRRRWFAASVDVSEVWGGC